MGGAEEKPAVRMLSRFIGLAGASLSAVDNHTPGVALFAGPQRTSTTRSLSRADTPTAPSSLPASFCSFSSCRYHGLQLKVPEDAGPPQSRGTHTPGEGNSSVLAPSTSSSRTPAPSPSRTRHFRSAPSDSP